MKLICGKSEEILKGFPDNYIDITITSPPYNKQGIGGKLVKEIVYDFYTDKMPEEQYQKWQIEIINELYRITKPGGHLFYNHKVRYIKGKMIHPIEWISKTDWNIKQEIIWDKMIAANLRGWRFWNVDERIYWLYKSDGKTFELESKYAKLSSIWRIRPEPNKIHPAQFPKELPIRILTSIYPDYNERKYKVVLDPFVGSGTTLLAAKELGFTKLIGIDISKKYLDYIEKQR